MFKFFRKNIKLFIWLIVLAFIIWGAGSSITAFLGESSSYAGKIGNENISQKEFLMVFRFYELLTRTKPETQSPPSTTTASSEKISESSRAVVDASATTASPQASGEETQTPAEAPSYDEIKAITWETIILNREAKKRKIRVTDEEVAGEIQKQFSTAGSNFNVEFYEHWVRQNFRGEPREFEEVLRKHLTIQKVREQILANIPEADRQKHWIDFIIPVMTNAKFIDHTAKSES